MTYAPDIDYIKDSDNIIAAFQKLYRPDLTTGEGKLLESFLFFLTHDLEAQKAEIEMRFEAHNAGAISMTKEEAIKEFEEYFLDADKAISEDDEYIRGWNSALFLAIAIVHKLT